jgi:hypothetical protein
MATRPLAAALALATALPLFPAAAIAACATESAGARCIVVESALEAPAAPPLRPGSVGGTSSASAPSPLVDVGQVVPKGEYSVILNADYYGLPPVSDGWVYMRIGSDAFRVDWQSHQVLERVTEQAAANF